DGTITEYNASPGVTVTGASDLVTGADGNFWYTLSSATSNYLGKYSFVPEGQQPPPGGLPTGNVSMGLGSASPQAGSAHVENPLDLNRSAAAPLAGPAALVYDSSTVTVKPILSLTYQSDPGGSVPTEIDVRLTWNNGTPQSWVVFGTTGHSAGDAYL